MKFQTRLHLDGDETKSTPEVRAAWRLLFEAWDSLPDGRRRDWFELRASIKGDGWSPSAVRQFAAIQAPHFKVTRPISDGPRPPLETPDLPLRSLISLDVEYPELDSAPAVPDEYLRDTVRAWRTLLERAVSLERDTGPYALTHISSLAPEELGVGPPYHHGLSVPVLYSSGSRIASHTTRSSASTTRTPRFHGRSAVETFTSLLTSELRAG